MRVDAFGECLVVLDERADVREIDAIDIIDENHGVRIAHGDEGCGGDRLLANVE